jgi:hypothetical protein
VDSVPNLQCLPSDPSGGFGVSCQQEIGKATCADGLDCDQRSASGGTCTYYCNTAGHGCPPGYECRETQVGSDAGPTIAICRLAAIEAGFGDDGGGGVDDGGGYVDVIPPLPDASGEGGPSQQ